MKKQKPSIGISHYNYALPSKRMSIDELAADGKVTSEVAFLRDTGFENSYLLSKDESAYKLVRECAAATIAESSIDRDQIDTLFLYRGVPKQQAKDKELLDRFSYPVAQLADDLGLTRVRPLAVSQQGCGGLFSVIDIAQDILQTNSKKAILCVAVDILPADNREVMYNVMSDAAGAFLITKESDRNAIINFHQQFQSYYWEAKEREQELLSAYFPRAQQTIEKSLRLANVNISDVDWVVPHNINRRSWEVLSGLLDISQEKIWIDNIARVGHTVSCDHIINLHDMEAGGVINQGDILLLFTFGFGANWSCLLLEY
ncbi:MAG: hypothetical protein BRC25_01900 [Parcubacteria group bacterium SW_6_46_9]|nr:MAG: hypothetical protein BRC25_01900 [Parcubacteria group bacterium SW_6_46_9]